MDKILFTESHRITSVMSKIKSDDDSPEKMIPYQIYPREYKTGTAKTRPTTNRLTRGLMMMLVLMLMLTPVSFLGHYKYKKDDLGTRWMTMIPFWVVVIPMELQVQQRSLTSIGCHYDEIHGCRYLLPFTWPNSSKRRWCGMCHERLVIDFWNSKWDWKLSLRVCVWEPPPKIGGRETGLPLVS